MNIEQTENASVATDSAPPSGSKCAGCVDEFVEGTHCKWCVHLNYGYFISNSVIDRKPS